MSKTPRTDVFLTSDEMDAGLAAFMGTSRIKAFASFARKLETELADKDKLLTEARAEIERLKSLVRTAKSNFSVVQGPLEFQSVRDAAFNVGMRYLDEALAAERGE